MMSTNLPPLPTGSRPTTVGKNDTGVSVDDPKLREQTMIPGQKSLAYIAILEDAIEQLRILSDIAPDPGKIDGKPISDEITKMLKEQKVHECRIIEMLDEQERIKNLPDFKTRLKDNQAAIANIQKDLQQSVQSLSKCLRTHPSYSQNLFKIQTERNSLIVLLIKIARELRDCRFTSLIATVDEEHKRKNALENTISRESEASELLKELQKELANEKKLLEEETNERNQVIQQLKDTIQEINALTNSEQKYIKKETKARESSVKQRCIAKETALVEEKALLTKQIDEEVKANKAICDFLCRQREVLEKQIQDWMQQYEEDTEAKTNELEALKQKRTADLDRFEELVSAYEELERVVEEDKLAKEKEAEELRIKQIREAAVMRIQSWWRKILAKRAAAKPQKKAKGGGGKKGASGAATPGKASKPATKGKSK
ncbi:uncharacterized protein BJ171DRAFT_598700 [Polychytrium aggregatum]|uniref:uncharacterized protein n=1 Tax=Polychytrium aggregatum TaxID=110093 RepID=UPI0022FE46AE|nr:uncharacterized protein BJ171DRAFT_598700 [Polychytrium aggregatum]KAI9205121.1 hypothetical protein BJ171DRAFT_598700 [Polychytrium aggregatum]